MRVAPKEFFVALPPLLRCEIMLALQAVVRGAFLGRPPQKKMGANAWGASACRGPPEGPRGAAPRGRSKLVVPIGATFAGRKVVLAPFAPLRSKGATGPKQAFAPLLLNGANWGGLSEAPPFWPRRGQKVVAAKGCLPPKKGATLWGKYITYLPAPASRGAGAIAHRPLQCQWACAISLETSQPTRGAERPAGI